MDSYTEFSKVYDLFMDDVPYEDWALRIRELLVKNGVRGGTVADLGCGTGRMTRLLADAGYDMIGVDVSADMLAAAAGASFEENDIRGKNGSGEGRPEDGISAGNGQENGILYINQDMRELDLGMALPAMISVCDCVNYITETDELVRTFRRVGENLATGGVFIFDFNTAKHYERIGESVIAENRPQASFIWENFFDSASRVNEIDVTFFVKTESGLFERFEECHIQRGYSLREILAALKDGGLEPEAAYDGYTAKPASDESLRICIQAKKPEEMKHE